MFSFSLSSLLIISTSLYICFRVFSNPPNDQRTIFKVVNSQFRAMALKAVHVSDIPNSNHIHDNAALSMSFSNENYGEKPNKCELKLPKRFLLMGHRGCGMNMVESSDRRMKSIKENSILSFNTAAQFPIDFVEFDVQVTKDDCPVIFHDIFILTKYKGAIVEKRVTDITLAEFLSYGPQEETSNVGKPLFRKAKDGDIHEWKVESDDFLCTLQEVFQKVDKSVGFDIELKFDDNRVLEKDDLKHVIQVILKVVYKYAEDRPIIFSSFQPDAALLIRKLQNTYPVLFLTNGGSEIYRDARRNSLDNAIKLCVEGGLLGIVSEVRAIFKNPDAVSRIKESKLALLSYGKLNNVPEIVCMQHLMGIEGVVVDLVEEITDTVTEIVSSAMEHEEIPCEEERNNKLKKKPKFSGGDLSLKLTPELIQTPN